jgi:hypothetical protein
MTLNCAPIIALGTYIRGLSKDTDDSSRQEFTTNWHASLLPSPNGFGEHGTSINPGVYIGLVKVYTNLTSLLTVPKLV